MEREKPGCANRRIRHSKGLESMNKTIVVAAVAALFLPAAAHAQTHDWSGWYAGVNAGQGQEADFDLGASLLVSPTTTFFPAPLAGGTFNTARTFSGDGTVYGAQGGYNWQSGMFVLGGEVDLQKSDISSSISIAGAPGGAANNPTGFTDLNFEVEHFATARARAGLAFDRVLVYGTGGVAYGKVNFDRNYRVGGGIVRDSADANQTGSIYGAGAEFALTDRISLGGEYMKVDLSDDDFDTSYSDGTVGLATIDTQFELVRARVNWSF